VLGAVEDDLVAAGGARGVEQRRHEAGADVRAARGGVDDDVLDVADLM
jgi:hypothetical protein